MQRGQLRRVNALKRPSVVVTTSLADRVRRMGVCTAMPCTVLAPPPPPPPPLPTPSVSQVFGYSATATKQEMEAPPGIIHPNSLWYKIWWHFTVLVAAITAFLQ